MADRRYIASDITDSGQVEQLVRAFGGRDGFWAATFFTWLIPFWDDDSRMIGNPAALRSKVFPRYRDLVSEEDVAELLGLMNDIDLVVWYEVVGSPGERYLFSPRFHRHQTLRADRYGPSRHPSPPGWQPDEDHPYGKRPDLRNEKRQRDSRRTVRVSKKKPANRGEEGTLATAPRQHGDQNATAAQPPRVHNDDRTAYARLHSGDEAPRHLTPPLLTPPLPTADRALTAPVNGATDRSRDSDAGVRPPTHIAATVAAVVGCASCGHAPVVHRGPRDVKVTAGTAREGECAMTDCLCGAFVAYEPDAGAAATVELGEPPIPDDPSPSVPPVEPMREAT